MRKAYSLDLRERVLAAVDEGMARERIVALMRVSLASIGRWVRRRREGRALGARKAPGMVPRLGPQQHEALRAQLEKAGPDLTLAERCARWRARAGGRRLSVPTMWRALRAVGWTHKKSA